MAQTVCVIVNAEEVARLEAIVADRNRALKHVQRAKIILVSAQRLAVLEVAQRTGASRPAVWRWQARYAEEGVDGLLRDKTRPPGKAPLSTAKVAKVLALTCSEPPGEVTHWTGRAMAKAMGVSLSAIQRIWAAHHLQPHRLRTFKRSTDPPSPPRSKTSSASTCTRRPTPWCCPSTRSPRSRRWTAPSLGLPLKPGKCGTMTHDYKRHGTTTLFAALNILDGAVIGRCMQQHRHQEFIRFLNAIERDVPAGKLIHAVLDNYGTHKHPRSGPGWSAIRAGCSTSPRPPPPGSTPSRASSPS